MVYLTKRIVSAQDVAAYDRVPAVGMLVRPGLVCERPGEVPHGQQ